MTTMKTRPDLRKDSESRPHRGARVGAPEILTEELARRIAGMIQDFPDAEIVVNWNNVIDQTKRRFGHDFRRNVLAQKEWDGRRLIHEAFQEAKSIQRRRLHDRAPKYSKEPRSRLRTIVAKLQSENLALREALAQVRSAQYDELLSLLETRTPLHRAVELRAQANQTAKTFGAKSMGSETTRTLEDARTKRAKSSKEDHDADEVEGD